MKILFCNKYNFPFSGTEVYLFDLMQLLKQQGHQVALFSMAHPRGEATPYDRYFLPHVDFKDPTQTLTARAKLAAHAIYSTDSRRRLRQMIADFQPDVAHIRNIYHHLSPSILWELKAQGVPVLYHLNDFKVLCPTYNMVANGRACEQPCTGKFWHVLTDRCYSGGQASVSVLVAEAYFHYWLRTYQKCVNQFLAPSRFAQQMLIRNGFDERRIAVLAHFQRLPSEPPRDPEPDAPILYFGRLSAEKGVEDLLRAMQSVRHIPLKIAGDGPQRAELEQVARELALTNVEFVGHLVASDLGRLIAASRFTVFPSRAYETFGKSILESYAWGRAVVASDLGSRRELVRDHETGSLFQPGNIAQLACAILQLAEQPQLAAQYGTAGRELVRTQYSPESHCQSLLQLYEDLRSRHSKRDRITVLPPAHPQIRVAFVGGRGVVSKYSGIESFYEEVGKRLLEMGHEVTVYCRTYFTPPLPIYHGMRLVRIPTIRSKHLETPIHTLLSTVHVLFSDCDVVHYQALGPALFSWIPRLARKKTIVTVQGLDWQRKKWGRVASFVLRLGEMGSAYFPDQTTVVSRTLQQYYRRRYGVETLYIPNGTVLRSRCELSQDMSGQLTRDNYILFLGRFSPEKNCHLLVEAFENLRTPMKLVLAGGSSHTDNYANQLRAHGGDQIIFRNWVTGDALEGLLTNAACFVLPSDLEGLSLALLDAMGAGLCVVGSDIPENQEVIADAGFTFRHGESKDLQRVLQALVADPYARRMAGQKAQRRVQEMYLWPGITRQIAQLYQELLSPPSQRRVVPIRTAEAQQFGRERVA